MPELDQKTLDSIVKCWVKFRRVQTVTDLDESCREVICTFLLAIAQDDPTAYDDPELSEDIALCSKLTVKASGNSRVRTGEL